MFVILTSWLSYRLDGLPVARRQCRSNDGRSTEATEHLNTGSGISSRFPDTLISVTLMTPRFMYDAFSLPVLRKWGLDLTLRLVGKK